MKKKFNFKLSRKATDGELDNNVYRASLHDDLYTISIGGESVTYAPEEVEELIEEGYWIVKRFSWKKPQPSELNDHRWKEWFTDSCSFYFGYLPEKDYRVGLHLGNKEGSIDLFVITFGYLRN